MSSAKPFDLEALRQLALDSTDAELGGLWLGLFIDGVAKRHGLATKAQQETLGKKLIQSLATVDTPGTKLASVDMALRVAATGKFSNAGQIVRRILSGEDDRVTLKILAKIGANFLGGRKEGAVGPVRKFIRKALRKNSAYTNAELWSAFKKSPPKGWCAMDNNTGRYIEGPKASDNLNYKGFRNAASKEREIIG